MKMFSVFTAQVLAMFLIVVQLSVWEATGQLLTFKRYETRKRLDIPHQPKEELSIKQLVDRIKPFKTKLKDITQDPKEIDKKLAAELAKFPQDKDEAKLTFHKLVVDCKEFWWKTLSYGEPYAVNQINFWSFMNNGKEHEDFKHLHHIYVLMQAQSKKLDKLVDKWMYDQNLINRPKTGTTKTLFQKVLVEGGGPTGLLATMENFVDGRDVVMVNNRSTYDRNRIITLTNRGQQTALPVKLMIFLGMKFKETFVKNGDKASVGNYMPEIPNLTDNDSFVTLRIPIMELEKAVKKRLEVLATYVDTRNKTERGAKPILQLYSGIAVKQIKFSTDNVPHNFAMLDGDGKAKKPEEATPPQKKQTVPQREQELLKLMKEVYGQDIKPDMKVVPHNDDKVTAKERAELEAKGAPVLKYIKLDVILCAGGVGDEVRWKYLSQSDEVTIPQSHIAVDFIKGEKVKSKGKHFVADTMGLGIGGMVTVHSYDAFFEMQKMNDRIKAVVKLLEEAKLADKAKVLKKYENIQELLTSGIVVSKKDERENPVEFRMTPEGKFGIENAFGSSEKIMPVFHENEYSLSFSSDTPLALQALFMDIDKLLPSLKKDVKNATLLKNLKDQMIRKFATAMIRMAIAAYLGNGRPGIDLSETDLINITADGDPGIGLDNDKLNFDTRTVNTRVFPLTVKKIKVPSMWIQIKNVSLLLATMGDSNINSHFRLGSRIDMGFREGSLISSVLRGYHHDDNMKEINALEEIRGNLNGVQSMLENTNTTQATFLNRQPKPTALTVESLCELINNEAKSMAKRIKVFPEAHDFEITFENGKVVSPKQKKFQIKVNKSRVDGKWEPTDPRNAEVTDDGLIKIDTTMYFTLAEAVLQLKPLNSKL
ncbi:hypothetical protein DdX_20619 [Ditylenchus destructor]|uniref:Uncharacterized protein n=1 Tax=Ditylenchus destructor TaxID=166010 RepID=A0AAD4MGV9_9BILA|nr:hypothetical protein DdX_20619 [Ditylenchus destructor]